MIGTLSPSSEMFLGGLSRVQKRLDAAHRQVASGLKVSAPSDAPDRIGAILQMRAELARNEQIRTNVSQVKAEVDTAEATVRTTIKLVEQARALAVQGTSPTQDASTRLAIDAAVESLQDQIVALSRTAVRGAPLFGNVLDASREIEDPAGGSFPAARTLEQVFDPRNGDGSPAVGNVFDAIAGLRAELQANNPDGIRDALDSLNAAGEHLNLQLGFYGAAQNRITDALAFSAKHALDLRATLGNLEDADIAAAILELNQAGIQQQAALAAQARKPAGTLFDYLG